MTISAAGCLNKRRVPPLVRSFRRNKVVRGYSLLELMIVMVVIGVVTSIAALSFSNFGAGVGEKALERLRLDVQLLSNESIVRSELLGLGFHNNGYTFMRLDVESESWQLIEKDNFLKPRKFGTGVNVNIVVDENDLALGDSAVLEPQIISLPTGEITPFTYRLESSAEGFIEQLKFDALGRVVKEKEDEEKNKISSS